MKCLKMWVFMVLTVLNIMVSYPQAMLKTKCISNDNSQVKVVDKIYKSKNDYLDINVVIPQIVGLENKNKQDEINRDIAKWTQLWIGEVKQVADDYFKNYPSPLMSYQLYSRYKVTNNGNILSFYIDYYQFTGGAHGITNRVAYNIDTTSGEKLNLSDIFKGQNNYKDIINKEINRQISKEPDKYFTGKDGFNGISDKQGFYVKNNGIVIYFGLYEIAPYAAGITEFFIPNKLIEGNMKYDKI